MEIITGILLGALVLAFIGTIATNRFEYGVMAMLLTFCSFVAVVKDTTINQDIVMLLYVPIIAMGMFSAGSFFRVKVR